MNKNLILNTDSYKPSHYLQMPPGTETMFDYIESRGHVNNHIDYTIFFGLQMGIVDLTGDVLYEEDIDLAEELLTRHGEPFNRAGWELLLKRYGGDKLPIEIRALPEGTKVPTLTPLVTIHNTDPDFYWLPSYLETRLLRSVWYPTTVATVSYHIKQILKRYHEETSDAPIESLDFKLHDFGARGVSSEESAGIGGCAHLINFRGTDTLSALLTARKYYGADIAGYSIPAAEHTTIISWGKEHETDAYRNMLNVFAKPGKLVAVVSDSYDIYNATKNIWGGTLKQQVIDSGATLVVRPDSGVPHEVVVNVLRQLASTYGYTTNSKNYTVLPPCIRVIQGDGIDAVSVESILFSMKTAGFAIDNIAFGMGGALLQHMNRDTFKFAMKTSAVRINGEWKEVYKNPITDSGKKSKGGILAVTTGSNGNKFETIKLSTPSGWSDKTNLLVPVYRDGNLLVNQSLDEIRARVEAQ